MTFPVPPDAREVANFEVVRGVTEMMRETLPLANEAADVDQGEWMQRVDSSGVTKAAKILVGSTIAAPAMGAKVSWTTYRQNNSSVGQSDALATKTVDLLSGSYQARTKLYDTGEDLSVGSLLVPVFNVAQDGGVLAGVVPGAMTIVQLQAVVGRIIEVAGGVMHYEAPGL